MTRPASPNRPAVAAGVRTVPSLHPLYDQVIADGPTFFWPLDDAPGAATAREVMQGWSGTHYGDVSPGAIMGTDGSPACYYGGTTSYSEILNTAGLNPAGAFTLECWAQFQQTVADGYFALVLREADDQWVNGLTFRYSLSAGNQYQTQHTYAVRNAANRNHALWVPTYDVTVGRPWHHVVMRYDPTVPAQYAWIDGVKYTNALFPADLNQPMQASTNPWRLGWLNRPTFLNLTETVYRFAGGLQYVAFYGAALTDNQIALHWALGSSLKAVGALRYASLVYATPNLRNYYPLGEAAGASHGLDQVDALHAAHSGVTAGVSGLIGEAAQYDGAAAQSAPTYAYAGGHLPTSLTLDAWVNPTDITGTTAAILARGDQVAGNLNYRLAKNSGDGRLSFLVVLNGNNYAYTSTNPLTAGAWNHVGAVVQGGQAPIVVLNGAQEVLSSGAAIPLVDLQAASLDSVVRIGASENTPAHFWPGRIQQLSVAHTAVSVSTLKQRYDAGLLAQGRAGA